MRLNEWQIAGTNPPFDGSDVKAAKESVLRCNLDLEIVECWNGAGCYTLSVGCRVGQNSQNLFQGAK